MAVFEYKAVSPTGETVQGTMEALNADMVIAKLQEAGNIPVLAREAGSGGFSLSRLRFGRKAMKARQVGDFTHQLATLLSAGLPLDRALGVLQELAEDEVVQRAVTEIRDRVREGGSLSEALEAQHGTFGRLYVNMVRAGELGGTLDTTLTRLAEYLERTKELKDSVISSMIYPIILVVLAVASLVLMLIYVVPQFTPIFEDLGGEMPFITKAVLAVGTLLQKYWWLLAALIVFSVMGFRRMLADPKLRRAWDNRVLAWRWIGDLVKKIETARLARTTGTLLTNGVPLLSALTISKNVVSNTVLREDVIETYEEVKTGGGLARNLAKNEHYPRLALQMISVGEETGQLDQMLVKVADTYDKEVRNTVDRLMSILTPVMTLLLAMMIGVIVLAILLPMLSLNDLVG